MKLYLLVIACFLGFCFSCVTMTGQKTKPPERWSQWAYPNIKLTLWLNKRLNKIKYLQHVRIDWFHFIIVLISFVSFVLSVILLVIDIVLDQAINAFLTDAYVLVFSLFFLLTPLLFEVAFKTITRGLPSA